MLDASAKDWSLKEVVLMANMIGVLAAQLETNSVEVWSASWVGVAV